MLDNATAGKWLINFERIQGFWLRQGKRINSQNLEDKKPTALPAEKLNNLKFSTMQKTLMKGHFFTPCLCNVRLCWWCNHAGLGRKARGKPRSCLFSLSSEESSSWPPGEAVSTTNTQIENQEKSGSGIWLEG